MSDPVDPTGLGLGDMSCHANSNCDHFALKVTLGNSARIQITVTTPDPNPAGGQQPIQGDDYDVYVYNPNGVLISGDQGASEKGNEKVTITHLKKFNGKAYDVAVRPWAVLPGSTYKGSVTALSLGS